MKSIKYLLLIGLLLYIPILLTSRMIQFIFPQSILRVEPEYPASALEKGIEGTVVLNIQLFEDGSVGEVKVIRSLMPGEGGLDEAAIAAVRQWRYKPGIVLLTYRPKVHIERICIECIQDEAARLEAQQKRAAYQRRGIDMSKRYPSIYLGYRSSGSLRGYTGTAKGCACSREQAGTSGIYRECQKRRSRRGGVQSPETIGI